MSDQFLGEIRIFAGNFAPQGWAFCNGQLFPPAQYAALFSLLGSIYGGDGVRTFGLPDLKAKAPMAPGQGSGLSDHLLGEAAGAATVTLSPAQSAAHTHQLAADTGVGDSATPAGHVYKFSRYHVPPSAPGPVEAYSTQAPDTAVNSTAITTTGGGLPHNNLMPYLTVNFIIALTGIMPARG